MSYLAELLSYRYGFVTTQVEVALLDAEGDRPLGLVSLPMSYREAKKILKLSEHPSRCSLNMIRGSIPFSGKLIQKLTKLKESPDGYTRCISAQLLEWVSLDANLRVTITTTRDIPEKELDRLIK